MLGAVNADTPAAWNVHGNTSTTLTALVEDDLIKYTAVVPKGTWFGIGFGHNGTKVMNGTDIILLDATWVEDPDKAKSTFGKTLSVFATTSGT